MDRQCFFYVFRLPSFLKPFVQPVDGSVVGEEPGTEFFVWDGSLIQGSASICIETCYERCLRVKENGGGFAPAPSRPTRAEPELGMFTSTTLSCRTFVPGAKPNSCFGPFPVIPQQPEWRSLRKSRSSRKGCVEEPWSQ